MLETLTELKRLFPAAVIQENGTELEYLIEDDKLVIVTPDRSSTYKEVVESLKHAGLSGTWRTTHEKKK